MCLLFAYLNDGTDDGVGYKMVLIFNRDENWERPTETACFRGENKLWIGGIDLVPGRKGGTWLGINRHGQVAAMINVVAVREKDKKGRGNLAKDFVTNTKTNIEEYLDSVSVDRNSYKPFKLILIDLREELPRFNYLNNVESDFQHSRTVLQQKTISFDSSCNKPLCKTQIGKTKFIDILQKYGDLNCKDVMIEKYIDMLSDKTKNLPDQQLQQQFKDVGWPHEGKVLEEGSALNVFLPSAKTGTRTNTVILVDKEGNCDFVERTLDTPVNVENPTWTTVKFRFKITNNQFLNGRLGSKL